MAEETKTLADLKDLVTPPADGVASQAGAVTPEAEPVVPVEPKIDDKGRSYATGKRKDAVARVWIKPGPGKITVNGRELGTFNRKPTVCPKPPSPCSLRCPLSWRRCSLLG